MIRILPISRKFATEVTKHPKKIFSGIQPTGSVHIGNYLGAIKQWVDLQNSNENVTLSIVDLHSITLPQEPRKLSENILEMAATLLACGIDPKRTVLFQQSQVPQHTELCWIFSCVSTMARLAHLPQYKEKSKNLKDVPLGLFVYPILQAADILLYKATHVPVGDDQLQHLQLTQDLARMFNNRHGEIFPIPRSMISGEATAKLRSLRDPTKKMSKSDPDPKSRICLTDSDDEIRRNIKKAVTDFTSEVTYDFEKRPGVSNLLTVHSELTGKDISSIISDVKKINTGQYKSMVAEDVVAHIGPIRTRIREYLAEPDYVTNVLAEGSKIARERAEITMLDVRGRIGFDLSFKTKMKDAISST